MRHHLVRLCAGTVTLMVLASAAVASAQGGPPLVTDDPDTPGPGYWEINLAVLMEANAYSRRFDLPRLDVNYGVGRRIQLKLEMPWTSVQPAGEPRRYGAGDAVAGVKWRFVGQEGRTLAWSVYPQVEFNASHASVVKGLVEEGHQALLPTEVTVEAFHVEINGEVGRDFVEHGPGHWVFGLSTEGHVLPSLELLAEVHGDQAGASPAEVLVNAGGRLKLTHQAILLLALGHTIRAAAQESRTLAYAGIQFNLPGLYVFQHADPPAARPRRAP